MPIEPNKDPVRFAVFFDTDTIWNPRPSRVGNDSVRVGQFSAEAFFIPVPAQLPTTPYLRNLMQTAASTHRGHSQ
jgi:hypothetical protein